MPPRVETPRVWEHILVPVDGSDPAAAALEHALDLAEDHSATVHALYVADTNQPSLARVGTEVVDALEEEGEDVVSRATGRAEDRGIPVVGDVVQGDPREVILESANADRTDLVVMGASGRDGVGEYVLGGVTERVVRASEAPVLTVRAAEAASRPYPYDAVLVPTDGSDRARAAVELGADVAAASGATLHLLFVVDEAVETLDPESTALVGEGPARSIVDEAAAVAARRGLEDVVTAVEAGSVARTIAAYAESAGIDLVVMGTRGRTGVSRVLLGSVTERVLRTAPVPVLTTTAVRE